MGPWPCIGISSYLGAKLRDCWAIRQAGGRLLLLGSIVLKSLEDPVQVHLMSTNFIGYLNSLPLSVFWTWSIALNQHNLDNCCPILANPLPPQCKRRMYMAPWSYSPFSVLSHWQTWRVLETGWQWRRLNQLGNWSRPKAPPCGAKPVVEEEPANQNEMEINISLLWLFLSYCGCPNA